MQKHRYKLTIIVLILIPIHLCQSKSCKAQQEQDSLYLEFERQVQNKQKAEAIEIGHGLFERLICTYPEKAGLHDLERRLKVAQDLAELISRSLKSRQKKALEDIGNIDIVPELSSVRANKKEGDYLLAPAEQLYWAHLGSFSHELNIQEVSATELKFLRQYYDLRMQSWIEKVATITAQVSITDSTSSGLLCYTFVLPLLYLPEKEPYWESLDYLYEMVGLDNLDTISDFCLLRVERPKTAMAIARYKVKSQGKSFSPVDWILAASTKCVENHQPDLAEKLLLAAIDAFGDDDKEKQVDLKLKIAECFGKCGDNVTAAERCKQIIKDFPNSLLYGKVISAYFAYLARQSKAQEILAEIEPALESPRCQMYLPQLMYIKWWALRKMNQQVLANQIGQKLIEDHETNPCIAPVLLAQATDALSNQHYEKCQKLLTQLITNFPQTNSAEQAQKILARLDNK